MSRWQKRNEQMAEMERAGGRNGMRRWQRWNGYMLKRNEQMAEMDERMLEMECSDGRYGISRWQKWNEQMAEM